MARTLNNICAGALATAILFIALAGAAHAMPLPSFPGFSVEVYANVTDPIRVTFAPDGTMFVGRDDTGSGGGNGAARIHKITPGGGSVTEYGPALADPDTVLYDTTGSISGTPGSVLIGATVAGGGKISAIRPDESAFAVFGPSSGIGNPNEMLFDSTGRMLVANLTSSSRSVLHATTGSINWLFSLPNVSDRPVDMAIDSLDRIYTKGPNGIVRQYDSTGASLNPNFSFVPTLSPEPHDHGLEFGIGGMWGTDLYAAGDGGDIWRIDSVGAATIVGSGFNDLRDLRFGPDGSMYASEFGGDRILRITAVPEPSTYVMAGLALLGLGLFVWQRRRA